MARSCKECGTAVPWGAPNCVNCGAYTHWRNRLATMGIVIGFGTVIVVFASLARVWLLPQPLQVQTSTEIQDFLDRVGQSDDHLFVSGAGRCKAEIAQALCVQTTRSLESTTPATQAEARQRLRSTWHSIAMVGPRELVFVDSNGGVVKTQ